jgi:hypothetical protein
VITVTVGLDTSNFVVVALNTNVSPSRGAETSTSVKEPNEILEDGAKPTVAKDLVAGFSVTIGAGLLVIVTFVAISE